MLQNQIENIFNEMYNKHQFGMNRKFPEALDVQGENVFTTSISVET